MRQWIAEGDQLLAGGIAHANEAIVCYEQALACGGIASPGEAETQSQIHLLGWAWMNRGNAYLLSDTAEAIRQGIESFLNAEIYLKQLKGTKDPDYLLELGALYTNLGQAHYRLNTKTDQQQVLPYYDQATAILQHLPFGQNPRYRHHLTALWFNRGNLYWSTGNVISREEAIVSYQKALNYGSELPAEQVDTALLLANIWSNCGNALKDSPNETDRAEGNNCFDAAVRVLEPHLNTDSQRIRYELATVLANQANRMAEHLKTESQFNQIVIIAQRAQQMMATDEATLPLAAQISINARRALCQAHGLWLCRHSDRQILESHYQDAIEVVDSALDLIRHWEQRGITEFRAPACRFFRLGEQLYRIRQPRFLAEFLLDNLDPARSPGALNSSTEMLSIARESLNAAIEHADRNCILIADTAETAEYLSIYQSYLSAKERLAEL
jgi:hypothetical protein